MIPSEDEFPYTIRLVGECLSSNGSTSMATVCACALALMDAGVPVKAPVAGISIGLVMGEGGRYVTLTDIQGKEDHMGDMDFKVAGTAAGITAIQLDMKVKSIGYDVIYDALHQAREARGVILSHIAETIPEYRREMSRFAPRMETIRIPVDKIGMVIGPGGKTIRSITEETGASVDIQEDGAVIVGASDGDAANAAIRKIQEMTKDVEIGEIYTGKVVRTTDFGAFVEILPSKDGMVHISELANYRVPSVEDEVNVGDEITVLVTDVDPTGRVRLSRRALLAGADEEDGDPVEAAIRRQRRTSSRGGGGGRDRGPRRDGGGGGPRNRDGFGDRDRDRGGFGDRGGYGDRDRRGGGGGGPRNRDGFGDRDRDRGGFGGDRGGYGDRDRGDRRGGGRGRDRDRDRGGYGDRDRDRDRGGRSGYRQQRGRDRDRGDRGRDRW